MDMDFGRLKVESKLTQANGKMGKCLVMANI